MLLYPKNRKKKIVLPRYVNDLDKDLKLFLNFCKQFHDDVDTEILKKAYYFNYEASKHKIRKSGDPFYLHSLEVATNLINFISFDNVMVASALLHETLSLGKDSPFDLKDIESEFGKVISEIVENIAKINSVEHQDTNDIEYYRRLILSLLKDIRILLIKLADRYHDMQTVSYLRNEKQKKLAEETMQIYVPLAHRLGLALIKSELEDMAFRVLDRENYELIARKLNMTKRKREESLQEFVEPIIPILESLLKEEYNVNFEIHGRVKHIYSIYNKTILRSKPIEELYDLIGIRIILDTDNAQLCYKVLEEISKVYQKIDNTFKDYIKNPKPNGYQSLHQAFQVPNFLNAEVQVRTKMMDEIAERGFAAHYRYKSGLVSADSILMDPEFERWTNEVREILMQNKKLTDEKIFEAFKFNLLTDNIYVLTPKHEVKVLPKGATVLDFAYSIHTEIGNHCVGAKFSDGRSHSAFEKLNSGEVVTIIQSKSVEPEDTWLNNVVTSRAKAAIKKYLAQKHQKYVDLGKNIFEDMLTEFGLESKRNLFLNKLLNIFLFFDIDEFYTEILNNPDFRKHISTLFQLYIDKLKNSKKVRWKDLIENLPYEVKNNITARTRSLFEKHPEKIIFSSCCLPVRGDPSIAIFNQSYIKVHKSDCNFINDDLKNPKSFIINFNWDFIKQDKFFACIKISSSKFDLIFDILSSYFKEENEIEIRRIIKDEGKDGQVSLTLFLLVKNKSSLDNLVSFVSSNTNGINVVRKGKRRD